MKKILYIGNRLKYKNTTATTIDTLGDLFLKEGYDVIRSSSQKNKILRLVAMCFSVIKNRKYADVVLIDTYSTTNFYYAVLVGWWCRRFSLPYIPILHGGNLPKRLKSNPKLSKALFQNAKINVSPSAYLLEAFKREGYTNVVVIPNSFPIENYTFLERDWKPKLLWVRSFSKIYNPILALQVLEKLIAVYPEASLCMVGPEKDGSLTKCKAYAEKNQLPVIFTDKLPKPQWIQLSAQYTFFINTTNFDNTPVSILEAMVLGLPVISTNVGGIPFLLTHEEDGLLVPPNHATAMANEVVKLLDNKQLALKISANAREKATQFDWEKVKHLWAFVLK